jgi:hypothetical protein
LTICWSVCQRLTCMISCRVCSLLPQPARAARVASRRLCATQRTHNLLLQTNMCTAQRIARCVMLQILKQLIQMWTGNDGLCIALARSRSGQLKWHLSDQQVASQQVRMYVLSGTVFALKLADGAQRMPVRQYSTPTSLSRQWTAKMPHLTATPNLSQLEVVNVCAEMYRCQYV